MESDNKLPEAPLHSRPKNYAGIIKKILLLLVLTPFLLLVLLQIPAVQSWASVKITDYLSAKTGTEITISHVSINLVKGIVLKDLTVRQAQDTLLTMNEMGISLRKNLLYIFSNTLDLSEISIDGLSLYNTTKYGEEKSNIDRFISGLGLNSGKASKGNPLDLGLKSVSLNNIFLSQDNENKGQSLNLFLKRASLNIHYIDLACKIFDINAFQLDGIEFSQVQYDENCMAENGEKEINQKQTDKPKDDDNTPLQIRINRFMLNDASVSVNNNLIKPDLEFKDVLDFHHFSFTDIMLKIDDLTLNEYGQLMMDLKNFSFKDDKGFELKTFRCDSLTVSPTGIELPDYLIETGRSELRKRIQLSYTGWNAFSDITKNVVINTEFSDAKIHLGDISHFAKALKGSKFIINNSNELLSINGRYFGRIDNLAGRDADIKLGDKLSLAGSFNTRDLTDSDNTLLNIKLERFNTSIGKLKQLFPQMNLPENFNKIGSINFTGRFDGYLEDFVAYGKMRTDVGTAEMDMRLDISQGTSKANYSGQLNLINFNLGRWSDNADFGLVNFNSKVQNGQGLTLNTLRANLVATVRSLYFKNYSYNNFVVEGNVEKNVFNGSLSIHDPNIDFEFKGSIEFLDNVAKLNFISEVKMIDLQALNLSQKPWAFSGNMDINTQGSNINDIVGDLNIQNLRIATEDTFYILDEVKLQSNALVNGNKQLQLLSDLGRINIEGDYDLPNVTKSVIKIIASNYPYLTKTWKIDDTKTYPNQKINFDIQLSDSKNFLDLAGFNGASFSRLNLKGRIDTYKNEISVSTTLPYLKIKDDSLKNLQLLVTSDSRAGDIYLHIDTTFAAGRTFNPIDLQTNMKGDTITVVLSTTDIVKSFDNLDIKGRFIPHEKGYELALQENEIRFLNQNWTISKGNTIVLGDKYFDIKNLNITDGKRRLLLRDIDNKGLNIILSRFDLDMINPIIDYDKMKFGGISDLDVEISDLFAENKDLSVNLYIPEFTINNDPYGAVNIFATQLSGEPLNASVAIGDIIAANVVYNTTEKTINGRARLKKAPLYILQYLLKEGITDTQGFADADITINGPAADLKINGTGVIRKGKTKLIYTGVTYYFDNQHLKLNEKLIDLTGAVLTDANGNSGTITGGLTHNVFKDFGVNATLTGNNVIALNTVKSENANYYGFGVGNITARFTGSFDNVDMVITGVTGPGTKLFIPVGNTQAEAEESFIKFIPKDSDKENADDAASNQIKGINIEINLTITPDAELSIIFDESRGDIIRGNGRGNMQISVTRKGDFDIFGEYQIENGEYLFTVALLPVAKPFIVSRGGVIRWTGDPINASLDIEATYRMRTAIKPFIEEYLALAAPETVNQANQRNDVDLKLKLGGTLFKPEIKFDLAFQNIVGELASLTDSKMRLIRSNELELNSQVLGLIVFNSFLPSNRVSDAFGAGSLQSAGINTLSEFVSSQLSMYLTSLLNTALEENGFIAGIDFEVGLRNNALTIGGATTDNRNLFPDEVEFRLKNRFKFMDERLSLNVGGNYVFQNQGFAVNQILPDFSLELILTADRKLKARLYGKYDLDAVAINNLRQKYGLGLAYRTEFGTMLDFEKKLKKGVQTLIEN